MAKIIKDVLIYEGEELSTLHYILRTRLSCPPGWVNKQSVPRLGNALKEKCNVPQLNYKAQIFI
jgi:hypothetical protein